MDATVPPNTTAEVVLPDGSTPVTTGSGRYTFTATMPEPVPVAKPALFFNPDQ